MANLSWQFYKNYYPEFSKKDWDGIIKGSLEKQQEAKLKKILESKNSCFTDFKFKPVVFLSGNKRINLRTVYPGLLTGSGYIHETGSVGEIKLGFFYDYTTGLPIIPGSSVKGVLRSLFPSYHKIGKKTNQDEKVKFIKSIINNILINDNIMPLNELDVYKLELHIFEGVDLEKTISGWQKVHKNEPKPDATLELEIFKNEKNWKYLSTYKRDIFHDAYITNPGKDGKIFGNDYITPHINRGNPELSSFTNPDPLQFLKVLPEVTFCFPFYLSKCELNETTISDEYKRLLFEQILLTIGIGAKTNVGYGQFVDETRIINTPPTALPEINFPLRATSVLKKDASFSGKIIGKDGHRIAIEFEPNGIKCVFHKTLKEGESFDIDENVSVICNNDFTAGSHNLKIKKL